MAEFETVSVDQLTTITLALEQYFTVANINGKLFKSKIGDLVTFIAPFVSAVGASGLVFPDVNNVLPNPNNSVKASFVGAGTFTWTGGTLTTTGLLNIIATNAAGTAWMLVMAVPLNLTGYTTKGEANQLISAASDLLVSKNQLPSTINSGSISYENVVLPSATNTGGDTSIAWYANFTSKILKSARLKDVTIKTTGVTTISIAVLSVSTKNGVLTIQRLHTYPAFTSQNGVANYAINDPYIMPAGSYLASRDTSNVTAYIDNGTLASYRFEESTGEETTSPARMAINFNTTDSDYDTSQLVTITEGDKRYSLISSAGGIPIKNPKQVKLALAPTDKIILYGTSISSTDYPWFKSSMEALTGATVYNGGWSGESSASLATNSRVQRIYDYGAKLIIVEMGANDSGAPGTIGTFGATNEPVVSETDISVNYNGTYYIQAVSHFIRKIKEQYYNIRVRANLSGQETEAERTSKIDALLKPYLVFCTPIPQKRFNNDDVFSQAANWQRKRDAVVECCNKYNVHCIDTFNLLGWDFLYEPFWPGSTDNVNNKGIYTMDGLHPNKYGYYEMSRIICGGIGII